MLLVQKCDFTLPGRTMVEVDVSAIAGEISSNLEWLLCWVGKISKLYSESMLFPQCLLRSLLPEDSS